MPLEPKPPKLEAGCELTAPVPMPALVLPFWYKASMRGSYQNSQVSYVPCLLGVLIDSPVFAVPTPMMAPPPPRPLEPVLPVAPELPAVPAVEVVTVAS